jgi:hypothetical protein
LGGKRTVARTAVLGHPHVEPLLIWPPVRAWRFEEMLRRPCGSGTWNCAPCGRPGVDRFHGKAVDDPRLTRIDDRCPPAYRDSLLDRSHGQGNPPFDRPGRTDSHILFEVRAQSRVRNREPIDAGWKLREPELSMVVRHDSDRAAGQRRRFEGRAAFKSGLLPVLIATVASRSVLG